MSRSAKPPAKASKPAKPKRRRTAPRPRGVAVPRATLRAIEVAAEAAWPRECCGLLVGVRAGGTVEITRAAPSPNRSPSPNVAFEIDPEVWLKLTRTLGDGPEAVVGLYHSHPGGPAEPSLRDIAAAWGPDLIWIISAVARGKLAKTAAFRLAEEGGKRHFEPVGLTVAG